jgi:hypothetical protein
MEFFVEKGSIVREIWGKGDTILFIFAGASAEFALNKAVDWLYFTGRLPADPFGRLFSTVTYAREIIFLDKENALRAIDRMKSIHSAVEAGRGAKIPDWAYRDVLFMLIYYSIASFEVLERKLSENEKSEVFEVFYRVGYRMGLKGLPTDYEDWLIMRAAHLEQNLLRSHYTIDLYQQYKRQLGWFRFMLLLQVQIMIVPKKVNELLGLGRISFLYPFLVLYKLSRRLKIDKHFKDLILPREHKAEIKALDQFAS